MISRQDIARRGLATAVGLVLLLATATALSQPGSALGMPPASVCGSLKNAYGPYDYTNPQDRKKRLPIVEKFHFSSDVYSLRHGVSGTLLEDIGYTLRAFPNHHLALDALARLHLRRHTDQKLPGERYSLACWFERAMRFKPNDGAVYMIYGVHLYYTNRLKKAQRFLLKASKLMPKSAEAHYDLGLLYVRRHKYALAKDEARKAYAMGYPLPGLRDELVRAGHWKGSDAAH